MSLITDTKFYIIGTPIGNLSDISKRVIETINLVDIIYAEDTRSALKLLNHLGIKKTIFSAHKDNEKKVVNDILANINDNLKVGLMSDAGMPTISDPGNIIVKELISNDIKFEVISSPTALIHALILSGLSGEDFYFYGFLPHKKGEKLKIIERLTSIPSPIIIYESPHRLLETASMLLDTFDSPIFICRELTKIFETSYFINNKDDLQNITLKGEFVIVVNNRKDGSENIFDETSGSINIDCNRVIKNLSKEDFSSKDMLKILKALGIKRNVAYSVINSIETDETE